MIQKRIDAVLTVQFDDRSSFCDAVVRSAQEDSFLEIIDCSTKSQHSVFRLMSIDVISKILGLVQKYSRIDTLMIKCAKLWSNSQYCETFIISQKGNIIFEISDNLKVTQDIWSENNKC
ncbi:hypothetical protein RF11_10252 [Thelohanellus kitauei]|uniref:Uncharacterized protein n=1 Tax=Thelohanellus kitauei TaxID=669202 RepID=A0A0C2J2W5_THEKT|nr:hypothetical protein RF11_10252 [Thelohanellus kitauei]